jgi:glycosyltransferase involved in cell wall biosynthesis
MKRHILIISQYFPPDITAAAFRIGSLCDYLLRNNYKVTVLTSLPHKTNPPNANQEAEPPSGNLTVLRVNIKSSSYILQYLSFVIRGFFKILPLAYKQRIDTIFATSPPLSVFSLGFLLSLVKRSPLIMDIRDLWPDTPVALGKMKEKSPVHRFFKRYEAFMYRKAHWITCVSAPMKDEITKLTKTGVSVVYNGIPEQDTISLPPASIPRLQDGDPVHVYYYGNIGLAQGLDILLDAAPLVQRRVQFHIVGEGALKQTFSDTIVKRGLANITIQDPRAKQQLVQLVDREAHILLINLEDHQVFHRTIPSKLFDYLLHCLPVVYGIHGEGAQILKRTQAAVRFEPHSAISLANAIGTVVSGYETFLRNARANNPGIAAHFTREKNYKKLLKIIQNSFSS